MTQEQSQKLLTEAQQIVLINLVQEGIEQAFPGLLDSTRWCNSSNHY